MNNNTYTNNDTNNTFNPAITCYDLNAASRLRRLPPVGARLPFDHSELSALRL